MFITRPGSPGVLRQLRHSQSLRRVVLSGLIPALSVSVSPVAANPRGGRVVHGDVAIGSGAGGRLQIRQDSRSAIIDWESFSIDAGELTQFRQPSKNAAVLNRVTGGDPSSIHGALRANGNVFVINPSGILVGPGGTIDVHGLVLSTLDVSNGEFLSGGDMTFRGVGDGVTNLGRINAIGGDVFLIGRTVTNRGSIAATGTIGLAAGEEVLLTAGESATGERIFVRAEGAGVSGTGIYNDGTIEGAAVELKAHGNLYALAINNKGSIRATGADTSGGRVFLRGAGGTVHNRGSIRATTSGAGSGGRILIEAAYAKVDGMIRAQGGSVRVAGTSRSEVGGSIDVSNADGAGGDVVVEGDEVAVGGGARIDASGATDGGAVHVGGGAQGRDPGIRNATSTTVAEGALILSDATGEGDAGNVVVWSDDFTDFRGRIHSEAAGAGSGGWVEVSGKRSLLFDGEVSTISHGGGDTGTLLLDPTNFSIQAGAGGPTVNSIGNTTLTGLLGSNHVVIATDSAGAEEGDITVETGASVIWNSANSLTLLAHDDIFVNANVQNAGTGGVHLVAGWNGLANLPGSPGATTTPIVVTAADFLPAEYGNGAGSVFIGNAAQTTAVRVGSRAGATTLAAHGLTVAGSTATAGAASQLGFFANGSGAMSGDLSLFLKGGGLRVTGGTTDAYAQIGHGGAGGTNGAAVSGAISISFASPAAVEVFGGSGLRSYAQIGHAGRGYSSPGVSGDISLLDAGTVNVLGGTNGDAYAQIGHGGRSAVAGTVNDGTADFSGTITVTTSGGDLFVRGVQQSGLGLADGRFASGQIGHGGTAARGDGSGAISLDVDGRVVVQGGNLIDAVNTRAQNFALIGHGGFDGDGAHSGTITVDSVGDVEIRAGLSRESFAQIGLGGMNDNVGNNAGALSVTTATGSLRLFGGNGGSGGENAYAMLGNGGLNATGSHSGDITVISGNEVTLLEGLRDVAFKLIGHGGRNADGNHSGSIRVTAQNHIRLIGGTNDFTYAQVGHGGDATDGVLSADLIEVISSNGRVDVIAGAAGSTGSDGRSAYAQIGLGGYNRNGDLDAPIVVRAAGPVTVQGGGRDHNFALIGNGGDRSLGTKSGHITVTTTTGNVSVIGGRQEHTAALIGHGGFRATGAATGDVFVETGGGNVIVRAGGGADLAAEDGLTTSNDGGSHSFARIGHGGDEAGAFVRTGSITVRASGGVSLEADVETGHSAYSQIGHGGDRNGGGASGAIEVTASTGAITVEAGASATDRRYAQIGHGGIDAPGDFTGSIALTAGGNVGLSGGAGVNNFARVGHGGVSVPGEITGDLSVDAGGALSMVAGSGANALVQFGHGGIFAAGSVSGVSNGLVTGTIDLTTGSDLTILGGAGDQAFALLGHGGLYSRGFYDGAITGTIGGAVTVSGGGAAGNGIGGRHNFAQVGHSLQGASAGLGGFVERDGRVVVEAEYYSTDANGVWRVVPTLTPASPGLFLNARGDAYLQLPDLAGTSSPANPLRAVTYEVTITTPGTYRFYPRWTGYDGGSDSIFFDIVELKDGPGGTIADHYEFAAGGASNFNNPGWHGSAGFELNTAGVPGGSPPAEWTFATAGTYTIRSSPREDGVALDALILQQVGLDAPTGLGPAPTFASRSGTAGTVTLNASGDVRLTGGVNTGSHAAIGHGGSYLDNLAGRVHYGSAVSPADVTVTSSGGNVALTAGDGAGESGLATGRYAAIGHHGHESDFDAFGAVTVEGGVVSLSGGAHDGNGARIGHGGDGVSRHRLNLTEGPATLGGRVRVTARGDLSLDAGMTTAGSAFAGSAAIGHGGSYATPTEAILSGAVEVASGGAATLDAGGDASGAFTQIGHGGIGLDGEKSGDVVLSTGTTTTGGVTMTGGTVAGSFAQIGHGGLNAGGDLSGEVAVVANRGGAIALTGGSGSENYAMIGHGDGGGLTTSGSRQGGVRIFGDGGLSAVDGGVANTNLFHQSQGGLAASDYLGGDGFQLLANGVVALSDGSLNGVNTMVNGNFATGPVSFTFANEIDVFIQPGLDRSVSMPDHTLLVTGGGLTMESSFQNAGTGDVVLVAGWDGSDPFSGGSISYAGGDVFAPLISAPDAATDIDFASGTTYGRNGAALTLGNTGQTSALRIGSRAGRNVFAGHGLTLQAGTTTPGASSQLGFFGNGSGTLTGAILVPLQGGGLTLNSGVENAYTQVGHGGVSSTAASANAPISVLFGGAGAVQLNGGTATGAYSQIGHGGRSLGATRAGMIRIEGHTDATAAGAVILRGGAALDTYAQIGHGGRGATGATQGSIVVRSSGRVSLTGGTSDDAYTQIGHGGHENRASHGNALDDLVVIADGGISLLGGDTNGNGGTSTTYGAYAQIGNGGYESDGTGSSFHGDIYLNFNPLTGLAAGGGDISLDGGNGVIGTYAQVGHGGRNITGTKAGEIVLGRAGALSITGGTGTANYAQLGHGGNDSSAVDVNGNISGSIRVLDSTSVSLAGRGLESYAQLGHGGYQNAGDFGVAGDVISIQSSGAVTIAGGGATQSYALLGHGGRAANGTHNAAITIGAESVEVRAGSGSESWALLGWGGRSGTFTTSGSLDLSVTDDVTVAGGGGSAFAQIGSGGRLSTNGTYATTLSLTAGGDLVLTGGTGTESYAMIGDGGSGTSTTLTTSTIDLEVGGNLVLSGGTGTSSAAHVGHGGPMSGATYSFGLAQGAHITADVTGAIDLNAGANSAYAQIGHGGYGALSFAVAGSDLSLNEAAGSGLGWVTLDGGTGTNSYAQIGHGGSRNNGDRRKDKDGVIESANGNASSGSITLGGSLGIALRGGSNADNFAHIGHGGEGGLGPFSGDISLISEGDLIVRGGSSTDAHAQIGHGGTNSFGANSGGIRLEIGGQVDLDGGTGQSAYVQIGHGGYLTNGDQGLATEELVILSGNGIALNGNTGLRSFAMIGNGGHTSIGNTAGSIYLNVDPLTGLPAGAGDIFLQGGAATDAFVQIGHAGKSGVGTKRGDIAVATTTGSITLAGAAGGGDSYAQVGHGGVSATGNGSGNISLRALGADGDIALLGGSGSQAMVMVGHGGTLASGTHGGVNESISLEATRDIRLIGGTVGNALVQVGNGGLATGGGTKSGDLSVVAGRDVMVIGGAAGGDDVYAQIGHGGAQASTSNTSGDITVRAGRLLRIQAGTNPTPGDPAADTPNYAQIGHGGHRKTGNHGVAGDQITVRAGDLELIGGAGTHSYAQIGNGGYDAGGNLAGDICVHVDNGIVLDANSQSGENAYVQIGHGGTLAGAAGGSTFAGKVVVTAGSGGVTLRGGDTAETGQYAQIGHGGISTNAAMSGDIFVVADDGGNLTMNAGAGPNAYVMVGHGDGVGTAGDFDSGTSSGTRQGGIQYFVDGDANIANGAGGNAYLHHRTNTGGGLNLTTPTYLGGNGYQYVVNGTSTAPDSAFEGLDTMINGNIGTGHIVIRLKNDVDYLYDGPDLNFNHAYDFIVMTGGDITFLSSYQNAGLGRAILVAGWDGTLGSEATINLDDLCAPLIQPGTIDFNDCAAFGNGDGIVTLGAADQARDVFFGSRQGLTAIAAHGLTMHASSTTANAATQVGFAGNGSGEISGKIEVRLKSGGLTMNSGTTGAYTQVGHGGLGSVSAHITEEASVSISFCEAGDLSLNGGAATDAYAQIGHGGVRGATHRRSGDLSIEGFGNLTMTSGSGTRAYTRIGNGGWDTDGEIVGGIVLSGSGMVTMTGGGADAHVQIGSGGANTSGARTGNIELAIGGLSMTSGSGSNSYAHVGHGGRNAPSGQVITGDISLVSQGEVTMRSGNGGDAYVQIGQGGYIAGGGTGTYTGDTRVEVVSGGLTMDANTGGSGSGAYVQIGSGGLVKGGGTMSGTTTVIASGAMEMAGGNSGTNRYVQIGAGGAGADGDKVDADVTVTAASLIMTAGSGSASYAQIGLGGGISNGNNVATGNLEGDVRVTTTAGGITMGGAGVAGRSYAQIGSGGSGLTGGTVNLGSAYSITGGVAVSTNGGDLDLNAAGAYYVQIGSGGRNLNAGGISGALDLAIDGDVRVTGGTSDRTYAMVGHGGADMTTVVSASDITLDAAGSIILTAGNNQSMAQIGHGGHQNLNFTVVDSGIFINTAPGSGTGDLRLVGGGVNAAAMIGHGGTRTNANRGTGDNSASGDIIIGGAANVYLTAGDNVDSYAQIGHAGEGGSGTHSGAIGIHAAGDVVLAGGVSGSTAAPAWIGHGGMQSAGSKSGNILVEAGGRVSLLAGDGEDSQTRIGHGGPAASGDRDGTIAVSGGAGIDLEAGDGLRALSQIGHGGGAAPGDSNGEIFINIESASGLPQGGGDLTLRAGNGSGGTYAQIGHGGVDAPGAKTGNLTVWSGGDVLLAGGGLAAHAQIGHGGNRSVGHTTGDLDVSAAGSIDLIAGTNSRAFALVGHGGFASTGFHTGDVSVTAGASLTVRGGGLAGDGVASADHFAQIGHSLQGADAGFGRFTTIYGRVVIEADYFDTTDGWRVVPTDFAGAPTFFTNARGDIYVQYPDGLGGKGPAQTSGAITYEFEITEAGTYQFLPRWTGWDGGSDSIFADIVELKDGAGGTIADWYEFAGGGNSDFDNPGWFTSGGFEVNAAGVPGGSPPAEWTFAAPGIYTLRINAREDGAALDAFVFQRSGLAGPSGYGPAATFSESAGAAGTITVTAAGDVTIEGGAERDSHAAIGHGGTLATGQSAHLAYGTAGDAADIRVQSTGGNVILAGGTAGGESPLLEGRYASIGHHGMDLVFDAEGSVAVEAAGDVRILSGSGARGHAQIGHGGDGDGDSGESGMARGELRITAGRDLILQGSENRAMAGHGGAGKRLDLEGDVLLDLGRDLVLRAGTGDAAFAAIGHGGSRIEGFKSGAIELLAGGGVELLGGSGTGAAARFGHGGNRSSGDISGGIQFVAGTGLTAMGGDGAEAEARIGHGGPLGDGILEGSIAVDGGSGPILLTGGAGSLSSVQIGHGGVGFSGGVTNQGIDVVTGGSMELRGGSGAGAGTLIGHGGLGASGLEWSGVIGVDAAVDLIASGGSGGNAFSQIGNKSATTGGVLQGDISVRSGRNLSLEASHGAGLAYAKIGHGDDFDEAFAALAVNADLSGDIEVFAGANLTLEDAMIGHANAFSPATASGGVTQIAASGQNPADPDGGDLVADADSEFAGAGELRFYLPRRGNNQIEPGARLNGVAFVGAAPDPSPQQRDDEYTIHIIGEMPSDPAEHGNAFGTGPAPANAAGFAFYYDTIAIGALVVDPGVPGVPTPEDPDVEIPGGDPGDEGILPLFLDDRTLDDWLREREEEYSGFGSFRIYYEGFEQYCPNGDSIFFLDDPPSSGGE